jgi:hypothetical protein
MPRPHRSIALLAACLAAWAVHAQAETRGRPAKPDAPAYKWVDDKGVLHYGDRIPPEYTKRERTVLNRQGVEVGRLEAQKTPEQVAEDQRRAEQAARVRDHDSFLLTTYSSVRDIEQLRDQRLQQMADQRKSTETYIDSLQNRLDALQSRAQVFRPYNESPSARRMPDQLAEELVRTVNEVRRQRSGLDERRTEEAQLRSQFQSDIDRFRQIRSGSAEPR